MSSPRDMYLDLMQKTLSFTLWKEPGVPIDTYLSRHDIFRRMVVGSIARLLGRFNLQLVKTVNYEEEQRASGLIWPMYADTMIGTRRLGNLRDCIEVILKDKVEGDLIETGVWRGGASIFMKAVLRAHGESGRKLFVADSFQGLPAPDEEKYPQDTGDKLHKFDFLAVSRQEVENNFRKYGLLDEDVIFLEGWFKDTLPGAPIEKLALIRLDGDMYESTLDGLNNLYPKLSVGGFCVIDDYHLDGCRQATDQYRAEKGITSPLKRIDENGVFWRK